MRQAQQISWAGRYRFQRGGQRNVLANCDRQQARQQRFETHCAIGRVCDGQALVFGGLRIVSGDDRVDNPALEAIDERHAIALIAERRLHLAVGEIVADIELVEEQRISRNRARRFDARLACALDGCKRTCGGNAIRQQPDSGRFRQHQVTLQRDPFRFRRRAAQAEPGCECAGVHHGVGRERRRIRARGDKRIETCRI